MLGEVNASRKVGWTDLPAINCKDPIKVDERVCNKIESPSVLHLLE